MSVLYLLIGSLCAFALAYRYYAAFIAARVLQLDDRNIAPSVLCNDGQNYVPTNKWVVFGHHFAAIAGAGPLIGPVLAAQYGWGPGFFWILLGSVFAGCVHDMIILFASYRHEGQSLSVIAEKDVSKLTGAVTAVVILFIILVALAGLGVAVVNALFNNPWGVFSIGMTIPIAMAIGVYMFKIRPGAILSGSIAGVTLVCTAVFLGPYIADSAMAGWFTFDKKQMSILLPIYGFCAAAIPVWLLLAPRDYLSTFMKIGVVGALAIGLLFVNPTIKMPLLTDFIHGGGPIIPGPWWPYVFITIACGAISGFHSLIGSGTTPKMIERETEIPMISYGAMLTEAFVAMMALFAAVTLIPADYFAINTAAAVFKKLNMEVVDLPSLSKLVGLDVAHRPGGAISLAVGMAHIFSNIGEGLRHTMKYWFQFIIMFEALFILTTIDAGTRVARYILQDILGYVYKPLSRKDWIPGAVLTSALVSLAWGYMLYTGDVSSIWPMFGATNQTLSALALAIGTTIILRIGRKKVYALITLVPCVLITVTTLAAGYMNIQTYATKGQLLNLWLSVAIIALVLIIIADNIRVWLKLLRTDTPIGMNDDRKQIYCPIVPAGAPPDARP
ncbi:carbon starvation protein [Syntrophus gentianae]|uniref:Carbon starvation protein n=1 Tax=Syntrophus gentianae TaxID=43775 RepID=A0A1H7ZJQ5_9BACT|nr:carbon starvation protein A [Syntrophus gentianae]SEM58194.1 carbon starvation protein [Syntrophus gentianae]